MDKFVVRIPRTQENPFRQQKTARPLKQMTIESLRGVVVFEDFDRAKLVLTRANSSSEDKLDVLACLAKKTPSADIIASTGLGVILRSLSGHPDEQVADEAKRVADYWLTCNLRKANRASIEVRCDARTQKLRDAARRLIQDSLKSTLMAQTRHRGRTETSSSAGIKRKRHGVGEEVDSCESLAVKVDESLVSDVGCVVSQTSLGYSKGIRIDLDRYNSMMKSLDVQGNSDSESSDEEDDMLFCNASNSQVGETLDSSRIRVDELLRDIDSYLDSQIAKTKNVSCKGSHMTPDKDDESLHGKDRVLCEENLLKEVTKFPSRDTKKTLRNEGAKQDTVDESNRNKDSNNVSELKVKHSHEECKKIRASKKSIPRPPDELYKGVMETICTDDGYAGSCESQSFVGKSALKAEKSTSRVGTEFQSKRKRWHEDKEEERHHKRVKTEPISYHSKGEEYTKSLCSANRNTNSLLLGPGKKIAGSLERYKSLSRDDIQERCCSSDVLVGEKSVNSALCETNLNEPHPKRLSFFSNEKSRKQSKKRSKDKPECKIFHSISDSKTSEECLENRKLKKHKKKHEKSESSWIKEEGYNPTLDKNGNCEKSEFSNKYIKESTLQLFNNLIVKVDESEPISLETLEIKIHQQQRSTGEEISLCNEEIKRENLGMTHEEDCTAFHSPTLKVGKGCPSESPEGFSCSEEQNLFVKDEFCTDTTLSCQLSPSIKTTCNITHKPSDNTNTVSINDSTPAKGRYSENESNPSKKESSTSGEFTPSKIATSTKENSSIPRSKSSSYRKESNSSSIQSSSSVKGSSSSSKGSSSSRKESSSSRKESSSSRKESSSSRKESSSSRKESSSSRKESKSSKQEYRSSGKESRSSGKESRSSGKESRSSGKESRSSGKESRSSGKESRSSGKESRSSGKESRSFGKESNSFGKESSSSGTEFSSSGKESSSSGKESSSLGKESSSLGKESSSLGKESSSSRKESSSSRKKSSSSGKESSSSGKESSSSGKESSSSGKESSSSGKESRSSHKESSPSSKKCIFSVNENSFSRNKSSSSRKESSFIGKKFSAVNENSNSSRVDPSISKELDYSSKESHSSRTKLNPFDTELDSMRNKSSDSLKEYSISEKESRTSGLESSTSRKENSTSKKQNCLSNDESSLSKTKKESSSLKKDFNSSSQDSNCTKKSSTSMACSSSGKLESPSNCVRPLDESEVALLSETIERELFQGTRRLVSKRYKQTVRRIVLALKHDDKIRSKFITGKLAAGDIVNSFMKED